MVTGSQPPPCPRLAILWNCAPQQGNQHGGGRIVMIPGYRPATAQRACDLNRSMPAVTPLLMEGKLARWPTSPRKKAQSTAKRVLFHEVVEHGRVPGVFRQSGSVRQEPHGLPDIMFPHDASGTYPCQKARQRCPQGRLSGRSNLHHRRPVHRGHHMASGGCEDGGNKSKGKPDRDDIQNRRHPRPLLPLNRTLAPAMEDVASGGGFRVTEWIGRRYRHRSATCFG